MLIISEKHSLIFCEKDRLQIWISMKCIIFLTDLSKMFSPIITVRKEVSVPLSSLKKGCPNYDYIPHDVLHVMTGIRWMMRITCLWNQFLLTKLNLSIERNSKQTFHSSIIIKKKIGPSTGQSFNLSWIKKYQVFGPFSLRITLVDFKRKAELCNFFFAKQRSLINNNSETSPIF